MFRTHTLWLVYSIHNEAVHQVPASVALSMTASQQHVAGRHPNVLHPATTLATQDLKLSPVHQCC